MVVARGLCEACLEFVKRAGEVMAKEPAIETFFDKPLFPGLIEEKHPK